MKKNFFACMALFFCLQGHAQTRDVRITSDLKENKIHVFVGGDLFTSYWFSDTLRKPMLYPVRSAGGNIVTRGFPIDPQPGEPTDHPHQVGIWFTYEDVNGLDFWNNSYAIPVERRSHYGWIRQQKILEMKNGKTGVLKVLATWENQAGDVLMEETTTFRFSGDDRTRMIDRKTTLTAVKPVTFHDVKDGLIGMRVAKDLQSPNGVYLTSEGKRGDDAWGTRAKWCMLSGNVNGQPTSITIFDHKGNPGYPTYWHARGYGLFAANPLGAKIFSDGKRDFEFHLDKKQSATFDYRIVIKSGSVPTTQELNKMAAEFDNL